MPSQLDAVIARIATRPETSDAFIRDRTSIIESLRDTLTPNEISFLANVPDKNIRALSAALVTKRCDTLATAFARSRTYSPDYFDNLVINFVNLFPKPAWTTRSDDREALGAYAQTVAKTDSEALVADLMQLELALANALINSESDFAVKHSMKSADQRRFDCVVWAPPATRVLYTKSCVENALRGGDPTTITGETVLLVGYASDGPVAARISDQVAPALYALRRPFRMDLSATTIRLPNTNVRATHIESLISRGFLLSES